MQKESNIYYYYEEYMQKRYLDPDADMLNYEEFQNGVQFRYGTPVIYRMVLYCLLGYCFGLPNQPASDSFVFYRRLKKDIERMIEEKESPKKDRIKMEIERLFALKESKFMKSKQFS